MTHCSCLSLVQCLSYKQAKMHVLITRICCGGYVHVSCSHFLWKYVPCLSCEFVADRNIFPSSFFISLTVSQQIGKIWFLAGTWLWVPSCPKLEDPPLQCPSNMSPLSHHYVIIVTMSSILSNLWGLSRLQKSDFNSTLWCPTQNLNIYTTRLVLVPQPERQPAGHQCALRKWWIFNLCIDMSNETISCVIRNSWVPCSRISSCTVALILQRDVLHTTNWHIA